MTTPYPHPLVAWLADLSAVEFWLLWGAMTVTALLAITGFGYWLKRARLIENTPTSRIRSAAKGYVELEGLATMLPGEPIRAPLSGRTCVWWSYRVEERARRGTGSRSRHGWHVLEKEESEGIFGIRDNTGLCIVDPDGATIRPSTTERWYGKSYSAGRPRSGDRRHSVFPERYRFTEMRIEDTDPLHALGYLHSVSRGEGADPGEEVRLLLARWKRDQEDLLARFDHNADGEIDLKEWETAREAARRQVLEERRRWAAHPAVRVLSAAPDGRTFMISASHQVKLARNLRLIAGASGTGFVLLVTLLAIMLSARLTG